MNQESGLPAAFAFSNRILSSLHLMPQGFQIRPAVAADIPVLREVIEGSVRRLQAADYTPVQIDSALRTVFGVDSQLIDDGTYLVVQTIPPHSPPESGISDPPIIVACGGWSKRKTLFGGDRWRDRQDDLLDPHADAAKIRAFFIHPDWARRGIGTMLLDACEDAAQAAGFTRFEMGATLTGAKLFQQRGYVALELLEVPLEGSIALPVIHMVKETRL